MVQVGRHRQDQAKEAARVIYGSTGHATRPTSASRTPERTQMSAVRRTFCLLAVFDVSLIFIIWVLYTQLLPSTRANNKWEQFIDQVERYDIKHSLFDIVMLSTVRFTLLLLAYALFRLNHWWMIAITTLLSCSFLLAKCFAFDFTDFQKKNALGYVLLIVSFSMAWVETWFLDFKVLPSEKKARQKALGYGYNNERSPLLRDAESHGSGTEDPQYYSPENSDDEAPIQRREF